MKRIFTILATAALTLGVSAQSQQPTEQMKREFRQTVQKRDVSQRHLESNIPLSTQTPASAKGSVKSLPTDRVWFPGEWEEVKAIVVTPYYSYSPAESQGSGYWMADPLVTGWADYYKYSYTQGWTQQGTGPYTSTMDTNSTFGKVFFYLMDGIQLGGAEAWVRVEQASDTAKVLRALTRLNLRHNNVKFLIGPGNSFWYRDCGPICFYYGDQDSVGMLDFTYYPGRALDDSLPSIIHWQKGIPNYITQVEWEGGNCLVDGAGMVVSSDAIYDNNADSYGQLTWDGQDINTLQYSQATRLTQAQVRTALSELLGQRATYIVPAYQYDGGTGHIDLYADMYDENGFVFSVMPEAYSSWTDYRTGSQNMTSLCSYQSLFDRDYYTMGTLPFPSKDNGNNFNNQTEYDQNYTRTYSNHTFVNNVILQPCFSAVSNGQPSALWDRDNIAAVAAAYPGYTIYPVDVREFDGSGGAIHCVTKQIPADNPIRILHKNIHGTVGVSGTSIPVSAIITNRSGINHAEVMYRIDGGSWQTANLSQSGNRWSGSMAVSNDATSSQHSYEYYISATSGNGKTMTKPITASQGGYYSFIVDGNETYDPAMFDTDTDPMPADNITFTFGTNWANEDNTQQNPHHLAIETAQLEESFGQFYPNPAADKANLGIDLGNGANYSVSVVDQTGRILWTGRLNASGKVLYTVDASRLAAGIYNVVFSSNDAKVTRRLIVK